MKGKQSIKELSAPYSEAPGLPENGAKIFFPLRGPQYNDLRRSRDPPKGILKKTSSGRTIFKGLRQGSTSSAVVRVRKQSIRKGMEKGEVPQEVCGRKQRLRAPIPLSASERSGGERS